MIAPYSQALGQIFSAIGQMISGFLNNLNTPAALKGGIIVALVGWIHALNKADGPGIISKILHPIQTLKDILKEKFGDGGGMLDQVKNTLKSYQREIKTRMLIDIAAAIGILTGAIVTGEEKRAERELQNTDNFFSNMAKNISDK